MNSLLKRRQERTKELEEIKEKIRKNLPKLDKRQIRRHRIQYEEALLLELQEDGFTESSNYLRSLLLYQDDMREKAGQDSYIWLKPLLKDNKELLDRLYRGLKETETALKKKQRHLEIDHLLSLSIFFASDDKDDSWWWLAEQLFLQTLVLATNFSDDGNHRHALVRFFYGRFLLIKLKQVHEAETNMRLCRELASGRNWHVADFLRTERTNKSLYKECCFYLYKSLLIIGQELMETDPEQATKVCTTAHKRAIEVQNLANEAECIYHIGQCDMKNEKYKEAIANFQKALIIYYSNNDKPSICETRIRLAASFAKMESYREAKYHLFQLLEFAKKFEMKYYEAQANRFIGELYLFNYMAADAGPHLLKALEIYHELDDYDNREQAKNIAAIAAGFQMMLPYRELIHSCAKDRKDSYENLMRMVQWKDTREPFYQELISSSESSTTKTTEELNYLDAMYGEWSGEDEKLELIEMTTPDNTDAMSYTSDDDTYLSVKSDDI